jgi:hypothetical protein
MNYNKRTFFKNYSNENILWTPAACGVAKITPLQWPYYIGANWSERSA